MKILVVIPMKKGDYNKVAMDSITSQSLKPTRIYVNVNEGKIGRTLAEKVSFVLNQSFAKFNLADFDYVMRVDADTWLPRNFIEANVADNPDLCASGGCAMLIRTAPFLKLMGGRLPSREDDSYIGYKFMMHGCKVTHPQVKPVLLRNSGQSGLIYYWHRGQGMYRLGYEPVHVAYSLSWAEGGLKHLVSIAAYIAACLRREKRYDVADWVFQTQVHNLVRGKRKRAI